MTPRPPSFPGLVEGDKWCLCAMRWVEAFEAGKAPQVDLEATSTAALHYCSLQQLAQKAMNDDQKNRALALFNDSPNAAEL